MLLYCAIRFSKPELVLFQTYMYIREDNECSLEWSVNTDPGFEYSKTAFLYNMIMTNIEVDWNICFMASDITFTGKLGEFDRII